MPEISRFYGLIITINSGDHNPPHFHVRYNSFKALIEIKTGALLAGMLPPKAFALVAEWTALNRAELLED
ncbi:MAG TPA: DUF4160 domain-containing protein [Pseudobdellovibrionaceae bacterium]|nr:DUF4160 domain-containing protein [Pseudobdellovibrionaceae bacterium]